MEQTLFYILAAVAVIATIFAITEKHAVHAIVYLVTSFFALAVVFYLLGAPLVAVFEVIIYAGAIMVLFLFVIMMLDLGHPEKAARPGMGDWWPALVLGVVIAGAVIVLAAARPAVATVGVPVIGVREFGRVLFQKYGIAVEIISMQLLFALVGALYLGRRRDVPSPPAPLPEGEGGRRSGEGNAACEEEDV
jgi:NADH-quinone oxidoreductase subunit J